jgi:hypothetical protein
MADDQPTNNVIALLEELLAPLMEVQHAFQQLLTECSADTAVGAQLDVIGALVGVRRNGLDDDTYRRYVVAQVSVNKSSGGINEVSAIARLILFDQTVDVVVDNRGQGTYVMLVLAATSPALAPVLAAFVQRATSAGVRAILQYGSSPPAEWFRFDSGPGFDVGHLTDAIG